MYEVPYIIFLLPPYISVHNTEKILVIFEPSPSNFVWWLLSKQIKSAWNIPGSRWPCHLVCVSVTGGRNATAALWW